MLLVRRLLLGLSVAALLCSAAYVAGDALTDGPPDHPSATGTGGPEPSAAAAPTPAATSPTTAVATYRPRRAREPRVDAGRRLLGPGDDGRAVRDLQARLQQIDWFQSDVTGTYGSLTTTAVRGFQAKRAIPVTGEVDRRTLERLRAMTAKPTYAEMHNRGHVPGALDPRCRIGRVLCIDKTSSTLRWVVDGRVLQTLDARFGATSTPTREGVFHVYVKSADHVSRLYGSAMPFAMFFSGGQAVHYSSDFAAVGYAGASHGCVNIRDYDGVARLFDQVRLGDTVVVYWS
ncbi:L,D-transpeptidase family protein [Nocardioides sp. YIM 152315]|uniref:L,D-transpeptidase family protein n=1 Tax=Nocardioides sp. YIM 152315 TaxID=3031760 RepID=UPI0023DA5F76|nr:L,D-transpeptidase family protein [Nocardioides sp. YIM 152315]MDF1606116.1 L,D-transpeptidase family protein [Nocardioides sp. YIM 152315]